METVESKSLPENAYLPLAEGETYEPMVPAEQAPPEATGRAIAWGLFLCIIFTVASAYSGLKVGQVMEAAIPISILAIGLARVYRRRSTVLENVIITSIGGVSGSVVAGAIFTLPALYSLKLNPHPVQTIFICLAGGILGVLFLIPLRRYFVREMHGKLPYPEATAITEVLVTGERGGSQAKLLLQATGIAAVYEFFVTTFHVWRENLDFQFITPIKTLAERTKIVLGFDATPFILGLGYVMGLRSSMILVAGGIVANFVFVPLVYFVGQHFPNAVYPGTLPIGEMAAGQIFRSYVRYIGVGAIATAGIFGIIKSLRVIAGSFGVAARAFKGGHDAHGERTDRDMSMVSILAGVVIGAIGVAVFFGTLKPTASVLIIGLLLTLLFSFFFTSVAANAIATTARNPVSGMTMLTIIISSVVLLQFGMSGTTGMFFVMAIAGMVCTALSVSGQTITDLKTGYWLGSTPATQERVKFLGVIGAAIAVGLTIVMLAQVFQFGEAAPGDARPVLVAPQASIMQALVSGFMNRQPIAYVLFAVGGLITVAMEMLGVPALIFALGMYLPLDLNTPALLGGWLSHLVTKRSEKVGGARGRTIRERGVILASGLMAGGALGGVFGAASRLLGWYQVTIEKNNLRTLFYDNDLISSLVSIVLFTALCIYIWVDSTRKTAATE
ncbi:MAG TPA: oligopeptide transporter, OPT family [Thermoanaerobaculia bacterium]|nr:oligopeptide transporter, OPT family [Thermoanaerobaculia bacterium]